MQTVDFGKAVGQVTEQRNSEANKKDEKEKIGVANNVNNHNKQLIANTQMTINASGADGKRIGRDIGTSFNLELQRVLINARA